MVLRQVAEGQSGLPVPNSTKSYWHTEPSEKLTGYRSTPDLPTTVDTIIIGTGMTGAFAARFLKESAPDASLLVLEAREACWGATGRNGGHCQVKQPLFISNHSARASSVMSLLRSLVFLMPVQ